jgi:hypothetical protein
VPAWVPAPCARTTRLYPPLPADCPAARPGARTTRLYPSPPVPARRQLRNFFGAPREIRESARLQIVAQHDLPELPANGADYLPGARLCPAWGARTRPCPPVTQEFFGAAREIREFAGLRVVAQDDLPELPALGADYPPCARPVPASARRVPRAQHDTCEPLSSTPGVR